MTDRLTDEQLDHIIETHRGTLAGAAKKKQVFAPVENLEQTIRGLEEAKERRAEAKFRGWVFAPTAVETTVWLTGDRGDV